MKYDFEDKVAVVTGAAQGIGRAIALGLAGEGAKVVIADVDSEKADLLQKEIESHGQNALAILTDVSEVSSLDRLIGKVIDKYARIDVLVNSAGICPRTDFEQITEDEWDKVLSVNLKGVFFLCQKVFAHMKKRRQGNMINIASSAGKVGGIQVGAHYSASKAAIICLTKTLALHGAPYGIRVNTVCPGVIGTEMTMCLPRERLETYRKVIPLGTIGTAEDVANAVLFLASDRSNYITGELIDVDGGMVMD